MPDDKPQGTPSQTEQGKDEPKFVTEEQLNRAISARLGDFGKKIEKQFETFGGSLTTSLAAKLDELVTGKLEALAPPEKSAPAKPQSWTDSPEYKAMQRRLEASEKQIEQERQEKAAAAAKSQAQSLRTKLSESLAAGGISGKSLQFALGVLLDSEKRVRFDEDERPLFKTDDGDELPLADGLKVWLKSDDAKVFLPPRGTTGSGHRPVATTPTNGTTGVPAGQLGQRLAKALFGPSAAGGDE